jgi:nucleotide-binding universal stress UspA family protein
MQIKTILLHMTRRQAAPRLLEAACALARRHGAHLIGMAAFSATPPIPPLAIPYSSTVIEEMLEAARQAEDELKEAFEDATREAPFVAEWVQVRGLSGDLVGAVMDQARAADLIIAGQRDPEWELGPVLDFPERLALESGRPVLLVPRDGQALQQIDKVAIAWNSARESTRAVYDALPFLTAAKEVVIFTVTINGGPRKLGTPAATLAAALARHEITTTVTHLEQGKESVAKTLLDAAIQNKTELLVMGAYGHSRFREFVFGGVTRDMTNDSTVPLLLSH